TSAGLITRTSCPSGVSWRAQYCAPPLASIPTTQRGSPRMKLSTCARRSCRRITTRPLLSAPDTANTLFAKSIPIVVISIPDPPRFVRMLLSTSLAHPEAVYKRAGSIPSVTAKRGASEGRANQRATLLRRVRLSSCGSGVKQDLYYGTDPHSRDVLRPAIGANRAIASSMGPCQLLLLKIWRDAINCLCPEKCS